MSTVADVRGIPRRPKSVVRRRSLGGGIAWIIAVAVLLAGVVALNVVVLQLTVRYDKLGRERASLRADIAGLQSGLSSASAQTRIEGLALERLGLVPAEPDITTYVKLRVPER
jgi:cell division protein FtsL